jgi:hypothetical protein
MLTKRTIKEAKSSVKNFVGQRCAEGFNSGVKGLIRLRRYTKKSYNQTESTTVVFCGTTNINAGKVLQ